MRTGISEKSRTCGQAAGKLIGGLLHCGPRAATLVKLRFFAGFGHQEAAEVLGLGRRAADRLWLLARTWLFRELADGQP
jgi:hypothetical protein